MSEIGTIGQIYEDRRTKKRGKLIERDNKFKTLLMESEDGKSFNITFSGFKSNWRKVDEPEQTVEEAMQEEVPEEQITVKTPVRLPVKKNVVKKKSTKKVKSDSVNQAFEEAIKVLVDYVDTFNSDKLNVNPKFDRDFIAVKIGIYKFIEVFRRPRTDHYTIACKEDVAQMATGLKYIHGVNYYKTRKPLNYAFNVSIDDFDTFLEDFRPFIVEALSTEIEEDE